MMKMMENLMATMNAAQKAAFETFMTAMAGTFATETAKNTHWTPSEGETYYFLWGTGKTDQGVFDSTREKDLMRLAVGNYYKTPAARDKAAEYLKVVAELKVFADENNAPINWDDHSERKYKLCYNRETGCVDTTWSRRKITDGIYFSSHDVAMAAVEAVGEDRVKAFYLPDAE